MRAITLPGVEKAILSDTVGFISDLPTQLVAAFRATLEEVTAADLILHVRDIANPSTAAQKKQVLEVLTDLGVIDVQHDVSSIPILEVWNKFDLLDEDGAAALQAVASEDPEVETVSAITGQGVEALVQRLGAELTAKAVTREFQIPASDGQRLAWLHAHGEVLEDEDGEVTDGQPMRRIIVRLNPKEVGQFETL